MICEKPSRQRILHGTLLMLVLAFGAAVRIYPSSTFKAAGFDELFYYHYVSMLHVAGVTGYPTIVADYVKHQTELGYAVLPPTRFLYIFAGHLWNEATLARPKTSLRNVACLFTILTLLVSYFFARRLYGKWFALGLLALMSCAPTQIHMAQHAMVDGFFAFWALLSLWMLWENLRRPNSPAWLAAGALSLACMVMTKENAFFAFVAMAILVTANRWCQFGTVTPRLLAMMFFGPLAGVLALTALAGGVTPLIETYHQLVSKSYNLQYAIRTGDGPWHRYLTDLLLVSPVVLILAVGAVFRLTREKPAGWFLTIFVAASYLIMCNVKYGMNLRYANMWDMPLRCLALGQLTAVCNHFGRRKDLILVSSVIFLCFLELRQYDIFFVRTDLYELNTAGLLHALKILK